MVPAHLNCVVPVVVGVAQEVEGVHKVPLYPVNHTQTVCLIHVFLWQQGWGKTQVCKINRPTVVWLYPDIIEDLNSGTSLSRQTHILPCRKLSIGSANYFLHCEIAG